MSKFPTCLRFPCLADRRDAVGQRRARGPGLGLQPALQAGGEEEDGEGDAVLLALRAVRRVPVPGRRGDLSALLLQRAAQREPHGLPLHPHRQAGVALALGRHTRLLGHAGDYRHHFCHGNVHQVQRHSHRPGFWEGTQLRPVNWDISLLHNHVSDDRQTKRCRVLLPADLLGLGDVHQLRSPVN